jgi:hypothetical protein
MTEAVRVEGLTTFRATCALAARRVADMTETGREVGAYVSTRGRANAPHLTGRLAASIRSSAGRDEVETTSGLPYANRTHWGYARFHQRPQPFLYDAVRTGEVVIVSKYADEVADVVGSIRGA